MSAKTKVLVCGATGFIGRNVAQRLAARPDLDVHGTYLRSEPFPLPGLTWHKADLTRAEDVDRALDGVHTVVQAAATTSGSKDIVTRPYIHVADNAVMNSLLLRASFEKKVSHFVFFSCTVMYPSRETPLKETDFDASKDIFPNYFGVGWTKVYVEKMCEFYSRIGPARFTAIRHSNVYGPHDKYDLERSHVFGATVTKVMTGKDKLVIWGSGEEARDLVYVSDLVDFVEAAMARQTEKFGLYNVGAGRAVPVRELVSRIIAASGRTLAVEHDLSKPSIKTSLCLDTGKARAALGWSPRVDLDEGIRRTLAWYKDNELSPAG